MPRCSFRGLFPSAPANVPPTQAFQFMVRTIRGGVRGQFPTSALLTPWANTKAQLGALQHAIASPPELLTFAGAGPLFPPVVGSRNSCGAANQASRCSYCHWC
jgi:CCR4-NOT transcription complex subunit 1